MSFVNVFSNSFCYACWLLDIVLPWSPFCITNYNCYVSSWLNHCCSNSLMWLGIHTERFLWIDNVISHFYLPYPLLNSYFHTQSLTTLQHLGAVWCIWHLFYSETSIYLLDVWIWKFRKNFSCIVYVLNSKWMILSLYISMKIQILVS